MINTFDNKDLKNAIKFLLFSYFGLTEKSDKIEIFDSIIWLAYKDATLMGAYNTIEKDSVKSEKAYKKATKYLYKRLTNEFQHEMNFKKWHNTTCEELLKTYEDNGINEDNNIIFSYGNAQKWVNMATKYMYILNQLYLVINPNSDFIKHNSNTISTLQNSFEVPIDSYIIDIAKNEKAECLKDKTTGWSKWDKERYNNFTDNLNEKFPIDWECDNWIDIAHKKRTNENNYKNRIELIKDE